MSTLRVNGIQGTDGVERYLARAWVNFNGTGTVAIRASGNVSSITDNGTGDYTVNFTTAMPDVNYCGLCNGGTLSDEIVQWTAGIANLTTTSFRIDIENISDAGQRDSDAVYAAIFR